MTRDDLLLAAEWLDSFDNDGTPHAGLLEVAAFLRDEVKRRERAATDGKIKRLAKKHGVPVEKLRARLAAILEEK